MALTAVTLPVIERIFEVLERLGISREAVVIPLKPASPGTVRKLPNGKFEIVVDGLYRFCRNPIYLAMFAVLAGFFLLAPTWPALVLFFGTYVGIRGAIAAEEVYLWHTYGHDYLAYASRVGRFLPYVGLLADRLPAR